MTTNKDAQEWLDELIKYHSDQLNTNLTEYDDVMIETIRNALQTQAEWKPIETAPKDGTLILLYGGDWIFEGHWVDGDWYHAYINNDKPTHWMPSFSPPINKATQSNQEKTICGIPVKVNTNMPKDSIMLSTPTEVAYSNGKYVAKIPKDALITYTDELKAKMAIQVRNLLFEYKFGVDDPDKFMKRGHVPVEHVQKLMFLYADLIIKEVFKEVN